MSPCSFVRSRQPCWRKIRSSVGIPNLRFHPLMGWGARARTSVATKARSRSFRAPIKKKKWKKIDRIRHEIAFDSRLGSTSYRDIRYGTGEFRCDRYERERIHTHTRTYIHTYTYTYMYSPLCSKIPFDVSAACSSLCQYCRCIWMIDKFLDNNQGFLVSRKIRFFQGLRVSTKTHLRDVNTIVRLFECLILDYIR